MTEHKIGLWEHAILFHSQGKHPHGVFHNGGCKAVVGLRTNAGLFFHTDVTCALKNTCHMCQRVKKQSGELSTINTVVPNLRILATEGYKFDGWEGDFQFTDGKPIISNDLVPFQDRMCIDCVPQTFLDYMRKELIDSELDTFEPCLDLVRLAVHGNIDKIGKLTFKKLMKRKDFPHDLLKHGKREIKQQCTRITNTFYDFFASAVA